jgi:threonylcarbamoyladenosine tRNA methylthiotransferase MtaB
MKVFLDTVGCRLNQAEIESMARQFRSGGHTIVTEPGQADLVIVNTCTVTSKAASDSRGKIRQAARAGASKILLTGCWATLEPQAASALPNVQGVVMNNRKEYLVRDILDLPANSFTQEFQPREPLPGLRLRTRTFIKAQDGCDCRCSFCITSVARGKGRSRPLNDILVDISNALLGGTKEIVLTGVHLGSWGLDFDLHLSDLIKTILNTTDVPRLRLSSLEPWDLDMEFFSLWQNPRLCRHFHLPLQSGCEATLKRMNRKTTPGLYRILLTNLRASIPQVAITTDIIAGFPAETEEEFDETINFIREMNFAGGHVFSYSARPGTTAAQMSGQIPLALRKIRNAALRAVLQESAQVYRKNFLGKTLPVLWESTTHCEAGGWQLKGLTGNYLRVTAFSPEARWNKMDHVCLTALVEDGMEGEIVHE